MKQSKTKIFLISGVPCAGKTTISFKLNYNKKYLIVQEGDIIRSAMRGYQESLIKKGFQFCEKDILPIHGLLNNYQTILDENDNFINAFYEVILRQKRKGISTIINGFNLMNRKIDYFLEMKDLYFVYLHFNKIETIKERLKKRNSDVDIKLLSQIDNIWEINNRYYDFLKAFSHYKNLLIIDIDEKNCNEIIDILKKL